MTFEEKKRKVTELYNYHQGYTELNDKNIMFLVTELEKAWAALEKISKQDYRGNRPIECKIAYEALHG